MTKMSQPCGPPKCSPQNSALPRLILSASLAVMRRPIRVVSQRLKQHASVGRCYVRAQLSPLRLSSNLLRRDPGKAAAICCHCGHSYTRVFHAPSLTQLFLANPLPHLGRRPDYREAIAREISRTPRQRRIALANSTLSPRGVCMPAGEVLVPPYPSCTPQSLLLVPSWPPRPRLRTSSRW